MFEDKELRKQVKAIRNLINYSGIGYISLDNEISKSDKIYKLQDKINLLLDYLKLEIKEIDSVPAQTILVKKKGVK